MAVDARGRLQAPLECAPAQPPPPPPPPPPPLPARSPLSLPFPFPFPLPLPLPLPLLLRLLPLFSSLLFSSSPPLLLSRPPPSPAPVPELQPSACPAQDLQHRAPSRHAAAKPRGANLLRLPLATGNSYSLFLGRIPCLPPSPSHTPAVPGSLHACPGLRPAARGSRHQGVRRPTPPRPGPSLLPGRQQPPHR